jgi:hypothetical protein
MWMTSRSVRPADRSRTPRALLGLLVAVAGAQWPTHASAQDAAPLDLTWNSIQGCPTKDSVLARLRQIVGPTPAAGALLRAEAKITAQRNGAFHLRLTTHSGDHVGVRNVDGKSCADLAAITAFWLAILLNSGEPLSKRGPEGSNAQGPPEKIRAAEAVPAGDQPAAKAVSATAQAPPPVRVPAVEAETAPRRFHGLLALPLGALSVGPLQRPSLGFGIGAGVSYDNWRVLAEGKLWASQRATAKLLLDEYTVDLKRVSLGLRACRKMWGARLELAPCVVLSLQHLSATGAGPNLAPETPRATWMSAGIGVQARLLVAPLLSIVVGVDGEFHSARPLVQLGGVGTVERLSPAAVAAIVGVEWIL